MAIILAAVVFLITVLLSVSILLADGMSDAPGVSSSPYPVFFGGLCISLALLGSHWLHMSW